MNLYTRYRITVKGDIGTIILNLTKVSSLLTPSISFQRLSNYIQATLMINCSVSSVNNINLPLR